MSRRYDVDDPALHLAFPVRRFVSSGWGLVAPQILGNEEVHAQKFPDAMCSGPESDLFFSNRRKDIKRALAMCSRCTARSRCLTEAMTPLKEFDGREFYVTGVWGGTTTAERARIRSGESVVRPEEHPQKRNPAPGRHRGLTAGERAYHIVNLEDAETTRVRCAVRAGKIVLDRGDGSRHLILPSSMERTAQQLEAQGCKRVLVRDC